jgi:hypothetical protein
MIHSRFLFEPSEEVTIMKPDVHKQKQSREWKKKNSSIIKQTPAEIIPQKELPVSNNEELLINSFKTMLENHSAERFEFIQEKAANVAGFQLDLGRLKELDLIDYVPAVQENVYYLPLSAGKELGREKQDVGSSVSNGVPDTVELNPKSVGFIPKNTSKIGKKAAAENIDEWLDDFL